jgi:hypothetical protein
MNEDQVRELIIEVISGVAVQLGADGRRGLLAVVCTGATVGFRSALQQVRQMVLRGYRVELAFSDVAESAYGTAFRDQLAGFPHISGVDPHRWLGTLGEARAVVAPLLSVNTLSKMALLVADNLATNLMLHGLFMGRPVIVARNGAAPESPGRRELGFHLGTPALNHALEERFQTLSAFGCSVADVNELSATVDSVLAERPPETIVQGAPLPSAPRPNLAAAGGIITAVDVVHAHRVGANLQLGRGAVVTPLAREIAARHGVSLVES